jgi:hypothetical protein
VVLFSIWKENSSKINYFILNAIYSRMDGVYILVLTARPTAPSPNTATVDSAETFAVFHAAPTPDAKTYGEWSVITD